MSFYDRKSKTVLAKADHPQMYVWLRSYIPFLLRDLDLDAVTLTSYELDKLAWVFWRHALVPKMKLLGQGVQML